jgi:hypothetical protein
MITQTKAMPIKAVPSIPFESGNEDDIRDYAHHLYLQSGSIPGRDLDNWLEAKACLSASIPKAESHNRLHRHSLVRKPPTAAEAKVFAA